MTATWDSVKQAGLSQLGQAGHPEPYKEANPIPLREIQESYLDAPRHEQELQYHFLEKLLSAEAHSLVVQMHREEDQAACAVWAQRLEMVGPEAN